MKHRISELEGALLDAAVAKAEGYKWDVASDQRIRAQTRWPRSDEEIFEPSTDWADGGPIIERERIAICFGDNASGWLAASCAGMGDDEWGHCSRAPLIAAMRAYVASKFGEEVEL